MATDQQVILLKRKLMEGMSQQAWAAGMSVKSARSWQRCALPSEKRAAAAAENETGPVRRRLDGRYRATAPVRRGGSVQHTNYPGVAVWAPSR